MTRVAYHWLRPTRSAPSDVADHDSAVEPPPAAQPPADPALPTLPPGKGDTMLKKVLRSAIALLQKPKQLSIERAVALATPVFAVVSAWLAGAAAKYGIHLDKTGVTVAFGVGATAAVTAAWKWLDGRSKFVNAVHSLVVEAHRAGLNASVIGQLESLIGAATSIAPALELPSAVADPVPAATAPMMPAATLPSDVQEAAVQPPAQVTEPATVIPSVTG